jgi:protein SCO1/2
MAQILTTYAREDFFFYRLIRKKSFWLIFWLISFSYPVYRSVNRDLPPPLPVFSEVPTFSLTNEFGKAFGSEQLKGKFYIVNLAFTNCQTTCPAIMDTMDIVQKRIRGLGTKAQLVTLTIDPQFDTPEVLYKYARKRNANPYVWSFLTGKKDEIQNLITNGFKLDIGEKKIIERTVDSQKISIMDISHNEKFVLVDTKGRIRGYYTTDKVNIDKMMVDLGLLVNDSFDYKKSKQGRI